MAKNRRLGGYSGPQDSLSMSSNSYQFGENPPPNTLYPEPRPLFGNSNQGNTNNFGDINKPPWQRNRDGPESFQDNRNNSSPWNRDRGSDPWGSGPGDSMSQNQNSRQEQQWNQRNRDSSNTGGNEGPSNMSQRGPGDSNRMNRQESTNTGWWRDGSAGREDHRGWGSRSNQNEPNNMQRGSSEYDRTNQYGGPGRDWMDRSNDSSEGNQFNQRSGPPQEWFNRGRGCPPGSEWNEGPGPDRMDRNRGQGFGPAPQGDFGGNRPGEYQNDGWRNRTRGPDNHDEETWRERRLDGPSRSSEAGNWSNTTRGQDREMEDRYMSRSRGGDYRWDGNGPIRPLMDTPVTEPMNQRKRVRSPDNRDVWQHLESHVSRIDGPSDRIKRPRFSDSPVRMQDISERERREMALRSSFVDDGLYRLDVSKSDLREKLLSSRALDSHLDRRDLPPGTLDSDRAYNIIIIPRTRFLRFNANDSMKLEKHLTETLHKLASTENYEKQPQLRFGGMQMVGKRKMVVRCLNKETAEWLLSWTPVGQRFKMRIIMQKDPNFLAIISFATKVKYDLSMDDIKQFLKFQNPGLEVWNWRHGISKPSPKGTVAYSFIVDGHTIRYLIHHKWELFFGVERLFVRRLKTNFGDLQALHPILT